MRLALNVPDFIEEIETQPAIWNSSLEIHSNKIERRYAWENVSLRFCENFLEQSVSERNNIILQFQRKWKSLRDSYSRELLRQKEEAETGNLDSNRKQYMYFEKLGFLQTLIKIPNDDKSEESLVEEALTETDTCNSNTLSTSSSQETVNIFETRRVAKKRLVLSKKYKMSATQTKKLQKKTKKENKPKDDNEPDEDRLFMLSLVPELQKVPDTFKLEIKTELLNVFKKTKLQYNNPQSTNVLTQQPPLIQPLPNVNQFLPNCNLQMSQQHQQQQQQQQQQNHDNNFNNIIPRTPQYIQQQPMQSVQMPPMQCISTQSHGHAPPPPYVSQQPYLYHHPPEMNHQQNNICNNKVDPH